MKENQDKLNYPFDFESRKFFEKTIYDLWYKQEGRLNKPFYYHNERNEIAFIRSIIKKLGIRSGSRLIDIGCGNGLYANIFAQNGLHVTAIDISKTAIDYCRDKYGGCVDWVCGDVFDAKLQNCFNYGFCNFFTFFNAFELPGQASEYGQKIMQKISPEGFLLFIWYSDLTAIRLPAHRFNIMNFTIKQLETLFAGFRVTTYAIDSSARIPFYLGKHSFSKYITRLSCSLVMLLAFSWRRVRITLVIYNEKERN